MTDARITKHREAIVLALAERQAMRPLALSIELDLHKNTVYRHLKELADHGVVTQYGGRGGRGGPVLWQLAPDWKDNYFV